MPTNTVINSVTPRSVDGFFLVQSNGDFFSPVMIDSVYKYIYIHTCVFLTKGIVYSILYFMLNEWLCVGELIQGNQEKRSANDTCNLELITTSTTTDGRLLASCACICSVGDVVLCTYYVLGWPRRWQSGMQENRIL